MEGATLIINAGSSSVKFRLYRGEERVLAGQIDRIGEHGTIEIRQNGKKKRKPIDTTDYRSAGELILKNIPKNDVKVVAHRVVHGGTHRKPVKINREIVADLWKLIPLAPLHMPPALELIEFFHEKLDVDSVACFDTAFHTTMPDVARLYAIPEKLSREGIIRYGFHGLAHRSMLESVANRIGKKPEDLNVITCQLGSGISLCAIKGGKSIDTTMGFTPLEGLPMGTRSGTVDPSIISYLCDTYDINHHQALHILENESGLQALGGSHDVRDLLDREREGDAKATLALNFLTYQFRKALGGYFAILGEVDAVVLAGGLSQAPAIRFSLLAGLHNLGIDLDMETFWQEPPSLISVGEVQVWVAKVDEEDEIRKMAQNFLNA